VADLVAVRTLRAHVEYRLLQAVKSASARTGIPFSLPPIPDYEAELKAVRTLENVAVFIEQLNAQEKSK
jgi:hypothetical protein